ncbi:MAG: hypothetical protein LBS98_06505 [Coriobacteriales bacterium]|jgi:hypothetical protein|nr:hypothetical protein [Coriobacteriales bacterium]
MKIVTTVLDKNGVEITLDDKTISDLLKEEGTTKIIYNAFKDPERKEEIERYIKLGLL